MRGAAWVEIYFLMQVVELGDPSAATVAPSVEKLLKIQLLACFEVFHLHRRKSPFLIDVKGFFRPAGLIDMLF